MKKCKYDLIRLFHSFKATKATGICMALHLRALFKYSQK